VKRILICTVVLVITALGFTPAAQASSYLTVALGRAQYASVPNQKTCTVQPDTVLLPTVAQALAARNIAPTVTVQLQFTQETTRHCVGQIMYASWADIESLHTTYGWQAVSAGDTTADYTTLSDADVLSHACGTLSTFQAHGFTRAWGMFAFPNSRSDARTQALVDYRFVTGTTALWDCSSPDWHDHWTNVQEEYCWNDYLHMQGRDFTATATATAAAHR
jgi:hypothetical protein